ncbi:Dimethyladenosine transferase 2, mitochondrial [Phytophthora pseudosyringae]|uniref:rRNA adenine N(6)-methyltransferase n=1 Tax=Phytophthora pseudosyringae TaxID=221518 RepID=A0A8T1VUV7_9STRA|nr:Dimethyladenosine transferase 2, mitochondrial [Phytophthora pseudosyringae]
MALRLRLVSSRVSSLGSLRCRWASSTNVSRVRGTPHLKRKLGQHLLVSDGILDQIVAASELSDTCSDTVRVLEIGPGTGNLTSALLQVSPKVQVHAVEFDPRMVEQLKLRFPTEIEAGSLVVEHSDFEDFRFVTDTDQEKTQEKSFDACVANIPYQLSSLVVSRLSSYMHRFPTTFKCAVLLVQEEFALRLLAQPGNKNYSRLSANTALVADVTSVVKVPREHFLPPPKVDSRVIKLMPRAASTPALPADDDFFFQKFDALLRLCFERKNKTLRALLLAKTARSQYVLKEDTLSDGQDKHQEVTERVEAALEASGLTSNRAVKVSVAEFMQLMQELHERGIDLRPSKTRHFRD